MTGNKIEGEVSNERKKLYELQEKIFKDVPSLKESYHLKVEKSGKLAQIILFLYTQFKLGKNKVCLKKDIFEYLGRVIDEQTLYRRLREMKNLGIIGEGYGELQKKVGSYVFPIENGNRMVIEDFVDIAKKTLGISEEVKI